MKRDGNPSLEQAIVQQIYRQREAASLFGVSVSTWKRYVAAGLVPPPVQIGPGRVGWLHSDLVATQEAWCRQRGGKTGAVTPQSC